MPSNECLELEISCKPQSSQTCAGLPYGYPDETAIQKVPVKHLQSPNPHQKVWKKGMLAWVNTDQGQRQVTLTKVGRFMAEVDTNHPLAGKTLKFEVQIKDVKAATPEEIAHANGQASCCVSGSCSS